MKVLERDIENSFVRKVKKLGVITRKLNGMGFAAWPDRMILLPGGQVMFIEFKRPGGQLSPTQFALHEDAAKLGFIFHVCEDADIAVGLVRNAMSGNEY